VLYDRAAGRVGRALARTKLTVKTSVFPRFENELQEATAVREQTVSVRFSDVSTKEGR
jgi:hypothetical protein